MFFQSKKTNLHEKELPQSYSQTNNWESWWPNYETQCQDIFSWSKSFFCHLIQMTYNKDILAYALNDLHHAHLIPGLFRIRITQSMIHHLQWRTLRVHTVERAQLRSETVQNICWNRTCTDPFVAVRPYILFVQPRKHNECFSSASPFISLRVRGGAKGWVCTGIHLITGSFWFREWSC